MGLLISGDFRLALQRQADVVQAVKQAVAAESIDLEVERKAVLVADRFPRLSPYSVTYGGEEGREEYNACMRPYITGKGKSKEERQRDFCIGAKVCSGKAQTEKEAAQLCATTVPKWVRQAMPKGDDNLSCEERITRVHETIDAISLGLKAGDIEEMVPVCAQLLSDVTKCRPGEVAELAEVAVQEVKGLAKRYYLKGEAKDAQNKLVALKELL